jgi:polysaccharide biosynthesis/export protein
MNRKSETRSRAAFAALFLALSSTACGAADRYVWFQSLPETPAGVRPEYIIDFNDPLDVRVYNEERLSGRARVRSDGRITLPLVGEVVAVGKTPTNLALDIQQRLQKYLNAPTVTVAVEEVRPVNVAVLGEVTHPGVFTVTPGSGVLQALALAGGFTDFADRDTIFVVRTSQRTKIRFTLQALLAHDGKAASFALVNGDVVSVE